MKAEFINVAKELDSIAKGEKNSNTLQIVLEFLVTKRVNVQPLYDFEVNKKFVEPTDLMISSLLLYTGVKANGINAQRVVFKDGEECKEKFALALSERVRAWALTNASLFLRIENFQNDERALEHFGISTVPEDILIHLNSGRPKSLGTDMDVTNVKTVEASYLGFPI